MRTVFVGIFVLLTCGICLAQSEMRIQLDRYSKATLQLMPTAPQRKFAIDQLPPLIADHVVPKERTYSAKTFHVRAPNIAMQSPCFTMRTYLFSQEPVGSVPRHTAYMICVPSDKVRLREAEPDLEAQPQ